MSSSTAETDRLVARSLDVLAHDLRNDVNLLALAARLSEDEDAAEQAAAVSSLGLALDLLVDAARAELHAVPAATTQLSDLLVAAARRARQYGLSRAIEMPADLDPLVVEVEPLTATRALAALLVLAAPPDASPRVDATSTTVTIQLAGAQPGTKHSPAREQLVALACRAWSAASRNTARVLDDGRIELCASIAG